MSYMNLNFKFNRFKYGVYKQFYLLRLMAKGKNKNKPQNKNQEKTAEEQQEQESTTNSLQNPSSETTQEQTNVAIQKKQEEAPAKTETVENEQEKPKVQQVNETKLNCDEPKAQTAEGKIEQQVLQNHNIQAQTQNQITQVNQQISNGSQSQPEQEIVKNQDDQPKETQQPVQQNSKPAEINVQETGCEVLNTQTIKIQSEVVVLDASNHQQPTLEQASQPIQQKNQEVKVQTQVVNLQQSKQIEKQVETVNKVQENVNAPEKANEIPEPAIVDSPQVKQAQPVQVINNQAKVQQQISQAPRVEQRVFKMVESQEIVMDKSFQSKIINSEQKPVVQEPAPQSLLSKPEQTFKIEDQMSFSDLNQSQQQLTKQEEKKVQTKEEAAQQLINVQSSGKTELLASSHQNSVENSQQQQKALVLNQQEVEHSKEVSELKVAQTAIQFKSQAVQVQPIKVPQIIPQSNGDQITNQQKVQLILKTSSENLEPYIQEPQVELNNNPKDNPKNNNNPEKYGLVVTVVAITLGALGFIAWKLKSK